MNWLIMHIVIIVVVVRSVGYQVHLMRRSVVVLDRLVDNVMRDFGLVNMLSMLVEYVVRTVMLVWNLFVLIDVSRDMGCNIMFSWVPVRASFVNFELWLRMDWVDDP